MTVYRLNREQTLPVSLEEAWSFFSTPANLNEITPPELGFEILGGHGTRIHEGQIITYRVGILPLVRVSWVTEIKGVEEKRAFIDEQRFGPYKFWHHRHEFEAVPGGVMMRDVVHYAMPFGPLGAIAHAMFVRRRLERIFSFRRRMLIEKFRTPREPADCRAADPDGLPT